MYTRNLTMKDMYAVMEHDRVTRFMAEGIITGNDRMAVSAMEELLRRKCSDAVVCLLDGFMQDGKLGTKSPFCMALFSALSDNTHDPMLRRYGEAMLDAAKPVRPTLWLVKHMEANKERYARTWKSGVMINAQDWARRYLPYRDSAENESAFARYMHKCERTTQLLRNPDPVAMWAQKRFEPAGGQGEPRGSDAWLVDAY